jgi:hypothetical protein
LVGIKACNDLGGLTLQCRDEFSPHEVLL